MIYRDFKKHHDADFHASVCTVEQQHAQAMLHAMHSKAPFPFKDAELVIVLCCVQLIVLCASAGSAACLGPAFWILPSYYHSAVGSDAVSCQAGWKSSVVITHECRFIGMNCWSWLAHDYHCFQLPGTGTDNSPMLENHNTLTCKLHPLSLLAVAATKAIDCSEGFLLRPIATFQSLKSFQTAASNQRAS
jgi:hypothetical protein